jgi:hypothetical protein
MAAYKMAAVKVTPPNDFSVGLIRSHMVVIHLFLMLCDLQRVVRDLCPTLYFNYQLSNNSNKFSLGPRGNAGLVHQFHVTLDASLTDILTLPSKLLPKRIPPKVK